MLLKPGETKEIAFLVGMKEHEEAEVICNRYADVAAQCETELKELTGYWHEKLEHFQVHTPSREFDTMINTWNAYNCFMTFIWSRAASFFYCGLRNGYGYRDTVQDIQGVIHLAPEMALEKIRFMLSAQVDNGGHQVHPGGRHGLGAGAPACRAGARLRAVRVPHQGQRHRHESGICQKNL